MRSHLETMVELRSQTTALLVRSEKVPGARYVVACDRSSIAPNRSCEVVKC